ncbi:MAG TPA: hypothetical protein VEH04_19435, partial [Verrucomicrobiae bacterium]|nr:hypothetical protein [Verrucomicrobiae bacterium]
MKKLTAVALLASFTLAQGAVRQWTNTLGGNWFAAGNWSPNSVPVSIDTANITVPGTYTIQIPTGTVAIATLNLGAASGVQTIQIATANPITVTNLGTVNANGILSMTAGGLQGRFLVQPGGQLNFGGSANKNVYNLNLANRGTIVWSGGNLLGGSTTSTVISNGGLWQITSDAQIYQTYGGPQLRLLNSGTIQKNGGTGTSHISDFQFTNRPGAIVQVSSGTLQFNGGTSNQLGGQFSTVSPGLISIAGGTWLDAGGTASGTGIARFQGGTLNLRTNIIPNLMLTGGEVFVIGNTFQQAGAITNLAIDGSQLKGTNRVGSGTLVVRSGGIEGRLTVQPGGTVQFSETANKNVYNLQLNNQGTVAWSGGNLLSGSTSSTTISNGGLWSMTSNDQIYQTYGGPALTFTNSGIVRKAGGATTSFISDFNFVNRPGAT